MLSYGISKRTTHHCEPNQGQVPLVQLVSIPTFDFFLSNLDARFCSAEKLAGENASDRAAIITTHMLTRQQIDHPPSSAAMRLVVKLARPAGQVDNYRFVVSTPRGSSIFAIYHRLNVQASR